MSSAPPSVLALFHSIREAFPELQMHLDTDHPEVEINMDIPRQTGVAFDVNLNLNGDELHLSAGAFWLEWFPCDERVKREAFRDAVLGILSGKYRIVEHYRGRRAVKAQLQRPTSEGWETIGTWARLHVAVPWRIRIKVLQNAPEQRG